MPRIFIGVGSNIEPEANVKMSLRLVRQFAPIAAISTFYETSPIDRPEQENYFNGVVEIIFHGTPFELDLKLLDIEDELGRLRTADKYASRTIDLDILLFGREIIDDGNLRIPDPDILKRDFVLLPLNEIGPTAIHPETGQLIEKIAYNFRSHELKELVEFTKELREEFI
ncbi:MAG TPA: 2-amino-4-hydroxy-6-hydroxymethyldihydropteridine diphosphokinase [bacterium]|jgi:2-amino-4-hydroxy-6-hydroxymethyldihydropteridine diphosphokinase